MSDAAVRALLHAAARPYLAAGRHAYYFARGKLAHDPVFLWILRRALVPSRARVLDVGCGRGFLLSLLVKARRQYEQDAWPAGWPAPPVDLALHGIELRPGNARTARLALGDAAVIEAVDVRNRHLPASDIVVLLDVVHYIGHHEQESVLSKAARALRPGGCLLLRVADTRAGPRFVWTRIGDHLGTLIRGEHWLRHYHRPVTEWTACLQRLGLSVAAEPMSGGTPFANVLLVATREAGGDRL